MPFVIVKKNGRRMRMSSLFYKSDLDNLAKDTDNCYTFQNTGTHAYSHVGACPLKHRGAKKRRDDY